MSPPWNWIKEICEWIGNAIKNIVKTLINIIKNLLENLWEALKNLGLITIETLNDVGEAVFHIVKLEIAEAFKKLWEALEDIGYWFGYQIQYIIQQLDVLTFGIFSEVWGVLSKLLSFIMIGVAAMTGEVGLVVAMITTSLLSATGAVEDPLLILITGVIIQLTCEITPIHDGLVSLVNTFKDWSKIVITDMYAILRMIARGLINKAREAIKPLVILLGEAFSMSTEEMWNLLKNIAGAIGGTVGEVYDKLYTGVEWVANNVKPVWDWIKEKINYMWSYVGSGITDVINWINRQFNTAFTNLAGVIKSIVLYLEEFFSELYDYVKPKITILLDWIYTKGNWVYNFVYEEVAKVWDFMVGAVKDVYEWAKDITASLWNTVKESAINAWNYIKNTIQPIWSTVKNAAIDAWNYITEKIKPFTDWVKNTIWPTVQKISKTLLDAVDWIEQKGKEVYLWYAAHIKPYMDQVLNLIHKAAIITEMVAAIREGKVIQALLTGIGILGGKIEEVSRNILKFYDGTLTSIMKGIGYSIGWVRKMISDMYRTASIIAEDVAKMGLNIGWDVLNEVGAFIADVAKATLGKVYITIGGIEKSVRDWIAYIREPVSRALAIIYQSHAEFHKYDYVYRAAYLRQLSTVTGRPFHYIYLPKVAFEGIK